ncbi:MAG: hypothetical protein ACREAR_01265 [Nitrosotalea sp.]
MKNTKTLLAIIPLVAIAAIAIGVGMSSNVLAQPTTPAAVDQKESPNDVADTPNAVDQKEGPNDVADSQTTVDPKDGPNDVNATDNGAKEGPNGDGDGEQKDSTELKK